MKQKLKMLVKIADLQMSLWNMRGWNSEPGYQATCVAKRNKWHDVKCRALSLMATKAEQEAGTTPFQDVPVRTRQGNIEEMPPISKEAFDSLVSDVLEEFPDASLSEYEGHPVINYHGRQFDLENTYFLSTRPDFVLLLEQDMRNFNKYEGL